MFLFGGSSHVDRELCRKPLLALGSEKDLESEAGLITCQTPVLEGLFSEPQNYPSSPSLPVPENRSIRVHVTFWKSQKEVSMAGSNHVNGKGVVIYESRVVSRTRFEKSPVSCYGIYAFIVWM